jgi:uncharacterized membrane protein
MTETPFKRGAVSPVEAIQESWRRIRDQYWLLVGITLVAILLGSAAPLGLLMGPMMCGMYLSARERLLGRQVRFEDVFKGFEAPVLVPSIVATLIIMGVTFVLMGLFVVVGAIVFLVIGAASFTALFGMNQSPGEAAGPAAGVALVVVLGGAFLLWLGLTLFISLLFAFTYPLIADRHLRAVDALKLSMKASFANIGGLIGLHLLTMALGLAGVCVCYVGAFLVMPISVGAFMVAYERVFGFADLPARGAPG